MAVIVNPPSGRGRFYPLRPVKGRQNVDGTWGVLDPLTDTWITVKDDQVNIIDPWDKISNMKLGGDYVTWDQYAKHQLGEVLKQHELADALGERGILRLREPYIWLGDIPVREFDLTLTYDELDKLLAQIP